MEQERLDEFDNPVFNPPSDKTIKLWRYMDFPKFMALLNSETLHLTRCDQFDDHFDRPRNQEDIKQQLDKYSHALSNKTLLTPEQVSDILRNVWRKYQKQYVFINCWHINQGESSVLWKVYGHPKEAVAIQTTYTRLRTVLPARYQIGVVRYLDRDTYVKEEKDGFFSVMCKQKSFEHERELRVCYVDSYEFQQDAKNPDEFLRSTNTRLFETVPIDLNALLESVRISPNAPAWFVKLVKDTLLRFGYDLPVFHARPDK